MRGKEYKQTREEKTEHLKKMTQWQFQRRKSLRVQADLSKLRYRITKINENQKTAELVHMDTNKKRLSHLLYLKKDSSAGQGIIPLKNQAVDLIRKATMKRERRLRAQTSTNAD